MRGLPILVGPLTVLLIVTFAVAQPAEQAKRYDGPIIDMHLHAQDEIYSDRQFCFPQPCEGLPTVAKSVDDLRPMTLAAMKRANIVLGVISGPLDVVLPWTEGDREHFRVGASIGPPDDVSMEELTSLFKAGRVHVLGEIWSQYQGIPIDDPSLDPFLALAHGLDVPVHVHVLGLGGTQDFPSHLGDPLRLVPVLRKYPGLRVYLENAAWPFLEEVTSLMYQYPTVYAELSTILHLTPRPVAHKYLRNLFENGLGKRIMFGSDQMCWPEVIDVAVDAVQSADFLSPDQKADVFYNNAAAFLRLTEEEIARHRGH